MAVKKTAEKISKELENVKNAVEKTVEENKPVVEKAVKEAAEKTEKAVKEAAVKTEKAAKKAASSAKKAVAKFEPKKTSVVFEMNGKSVTSEDVVKKVTKACKGKTAKKLEIYVNTNEGAAYYVLDGEALPEYKVEL